MEARGQVRISQCMIAKNEEKNIERALSWGKSVMWEQIVVDTGSTDRTVLLAEQMGAKVVSFPWIDDFAAAKNYAIEQAQGDWIAFLDADEYMTSEDAGKLKIFLDRLPPDTYDGISTGWQQLDENGKIFSSGTQIRIFRNRPDIRYRRRIHEQLESVSGRVLSIGDAVQELSIFHTGYQGKDFEEKKRSGRNRRLIRKELEEHPDDYEMLGYLGDEEYVDGDMDKAREYYSRAIAAMPVSLDTSDQRSAVTFTRLLTILTEGAQASWEKAEPIYRQAVGLLPEEADFDYIVGRYFAASGETARAIQYLEAALKKLERYGCSNKALLLASGLFEAYELLVRCLYEAGEKEKCISYAVVCLKYDKFAMSSLSRLFMLLVPGSSGEGNQEAYHQVLRFLGEIYDLNQLKDRLFLIKAAEKSGCPGFADYAAKKLFTPAERRIFYSKMP